MLAFNGPHLLNNFIQKMLLVASHPGWPGPHWTLAMILQNCTAFSSYIINPKISQSDRKVDCFIVKQRYHQPRYETMRHPHISFYFSLKMKESHWYLSLMLQCCNFFFKCVSKLLRNS